MKIGLLVSKDWYKKSKSTMIIREYLRKRNFEAEECCWGMTEDWSRYDFVLICAAWGYQNDYQRYLKVLEQIEKQTVLFNAVKIVSENIDKEKQINLLKGFDLPVIHTVFLSKTPNHGGDKVYTFTKDLDISAIAEKELHSDVFVLKPSVSASGNHTVVYSHDLSLQNRIDTVEELKQYCETVLRDNSDIKILMQPLLKGIANGEYALIYINQRFSHAVIRYPGVIGKWEKTKVIDKVPQSLMDIGNKTAKLLWQETMLYMRVDLVQEENEVKIMEVECNEPELYIYQLDETTRTQVMKRLTDCIVEMWKKNEFGRHDENDIVC